MRFINELDELMERGFVAQSTDPLLISEQLRKPSVAYVGFDPTADSLHVGHLLPLRMIDLLVQYGHKCIILLGTATGQIGDPTGKSSSRKMLSQEEVQSNANNILDQINHIMCRRGVSEELIFCRNSEFALSDIEFISKIASHFSVNEFVKRKTFSERLRNEEHLSVMEFIYPLLQAKDWLFLFEKYDCTLQIAGLDQWTNCCAGESLISKVLGKTSHIICTPLLSINGEKMGKTSDGGTIWLDKKKTIPFDMWQFFRNLPDECIVQLAKFFIDISIDSIKEISKEHINQLKAMLATDIVSFVHGKEVADICASAAEAIFHQNKLDADLLPKIQVEFPISIIDAFIASGLCSSRSDVKRCMQNGGLKINGEKVCGNDIIVSGIVLSHGKKMIALVEKEPQ